MIEDIIKPIKLLKGSHADTGDTGQGCFMNVAAYLNGDAVITDESPCVCATIKPLAIWLNDYLKDDERHVMIPFIERALGSATDDKDEMERRVNLVAQFAQNCASHAAKYAKSAQYAAHYAAKYAESTAKYAAQYAAKYAAKCAESAESVINRTQLIALTLDFLDEALPPSQEPSGITIARARELADMAGGEG